ncbi:MAG: hypothetical protein QOD83_3466 [Solirubrobacteraceae bacterium]|jgi:hypothetical protein|nr:hypothetical protein [Solirubrobacteraceae bacterium]
MTQPSYRNGAHRLRRPAADPTRPVRGSLVDDVGDKLITLVVASSIILIQIPVLVGHQSITTPAVLVIFMLCIAWGLPRHNRLADRSLLWLVAAFSVLVGVALVRGGRAQAYASLSHALAEALTYGAVIALAVLALSTSRTDRERRQRMIAVALAPAVYALANMIAHLLNLHAATVEIEGIATLQPASLLQTFHIYVSRVQFPLSTGVNNTGIIAAAGLTACLVLWRLLPRALAGVCVIGCLYCLLLGDSRIPLLMALLTALYFNWSKRTSGVRWFVLLLPVLPLIMIGASDLLNGLLGEHLTRSSGGGDFSTLGDRTYIWQAVWPYLDHVGFQQLLGWGTNGNVTSGASLHYAYLFSSLPNPTLYSTHNLATQTIFETGYVGLTLLVILAWATATRLTQAVAGSTSRLPRALMASLTVLLLSGTTEAAPTSGSHDILAAVFLICGVAAALEPAVSRHAQRGRTPAAALPADHSTPRDLGSRPPRRPAWAPPTSGSTRG